MPVTSHTNGTSPFSNYLERSSTPSYRLRHEYRGGHKPNDELDRISTLQSLNILDTKPEAKYDDITKLLCSIFDMPIGQLSLVDSNRQWCKSLQGHDMREIDRNTAFCAWVLLPKHPQALMVEDTLLDARYVPLTCIILPSCKPSACRQVVEVASPSCQASYNLKKHGMLHAATPQCSSTTVCSALGSLPYVRRDVATLCSYKMQHF